MLDIETTSLSLFFSHISVRAMTSSLDLEISRIWSDLLHMLLQLMRPMSQVVFLGTDEIFYVVMPCCVSLFGMVFFRSVITTGIGLRPPLQPLCTRATLAMPTCLSASNNPLGSARTDSPVLTDLSSSAVYRITRDGSETRWSMADDCSSKLLGLYSSAVHSKHGIMYPTFATNVFNW